MSYISSISNDADNLLKRYLTREDRKNCSITFIDRDGIRCILEDGNETNEIVIQRQTNLSIRDFSNLIERTSNTSNRVYHSDYIDIQEALHRLGKTVCYYLVYSTVDKRFKDIIAVPFNGNVFC